jgi:DNA-binding NtrC family response regulator
MARILVIEDHETMREGIGQILARMGHEILPALNGSSGLEIFGRSAPDFTITDLKMEDLDGMEVLRRIRSASADALVMIITAFGTIETAVEAMKLGAYDFITKPFSPDLLRIKVASALEFGRTRAENLFLRTEVARLSDPARRNPIGPADLPGGLKNINDHVDLTLPPRGVHLNEALEQLERQLILRAVEEARGVKTRTAELLGIKPSALYYKLQKHGIRTGNDE